jgi:hypothetical protein
MSPRGVAARPLTRRSRREHIHSVVRLPRRKVLHNNHAAVRISGGTNCNIDRRHTRAAGIMSNCCCMHSRTHGHSTMLQLRHFNGCEVTIRDVDRVVSNANDYSRATSVRACGTAVYASGGSCPDTCPDSQSVNRRGPSEPPPGRRHLSRTVSHISIRTLRAADRSRRQFHGAHAVLLDTRAQGLIRNEFVLGPPDLYRKDIAAIRGSRRTCGC